MKNYSIIEDLALDLWKKNITPKDHDKILSECLKRNSLLIRKYSNVKNKPNFNIQKKNLPSIHISHSNYQTIIKKHRSSQSSGSKLQVVRDLADSKAPAQLRTQIQKCPFVCQQNQIIIKSQQISKTQPSESQIQAGLKIFTPKILSLLENFDSNQNQESKTPSRQSKVLFHIKSIKKMVPVCKSEQKKSSPNQKSSDGIFHASIYNDSIDFHKRKFFASIQNQESLAKPKHQKQSRNTYTDQKSFTKKMFGVMRLRKSTKILKAKLFTQLQIKHLELNQNQKQNFNRHKYEKNIYFQRFNEIPDFRLKGKVFTPTGSQTSLNLLDQMTPNSNREISQYTTFNFRQKRAIKIEKKNILTNLKERICFFDQNNESKNDSQSISAFNKMLKQSNKQLRFPTFNENRDMKNKTGDNHHLVSK